jgi:hypothetical protein
MPNKSQKTDNSEGSSAPEPSTSRDQLALDLSSFQLEQCVVEIRYPLALRLWDNAGAFWQQIQEKWPELRPLHSEPAKQTFQSGNIGFVVELEQARITGMAPDRSLERFATQARDFVANITKYLSVPVYKRVGMRVIYFREFTDKPAAASALLRMGLLKVPEGKKRFDVEGDPITPHYALRWESTKKGALLQCRAESRKVDFDPPPEISKDLQPVHKEKHGLVIDIDYYTVAAVEPAQMDIAEWMKHSLHVISRDTSYLFEQS